MWPFASAALLLAAGGLAGALGQADSAASFDLGAVLNGLAGSSPVAGVLAWRLHRSDQEVAAERAENKKLNDRAVDLTERLAPLLAEATRALGEVQAGMRATLERGRPVDDVAARKLETAVSRLVEHLDER